MTDDLTILDWERRHGVTRLYLACDPEPGWSGDDWDDAPFEHNAGTVLPGFYTHTADVVADWGHVLLDPSDDWRTANSRWSKEDMRARRCPILVAAADPDDLLAAGWPTALAADGAVRVYMGDPWSRLASASGVVVIDGPRPAGEAVR